jgi:hypothetical protein
MARCDAHLAKSDTPAWAAGCARQAPQSTYPVVTAQQNGAHTAKSPRRKSVLDKKLSRAANIDGR